MLYENDNSVFLFDGTSGIERYMERVQKEMADVIVVENVCNEKTHIIIQV